LSLTESVFLAEKQDEKERQGKIGENLSGCARQAKICNRKRTGKIGKSRRRRVANTRKIKIRKFVKETFIIVLTGYGGSF